MNEIDWTKLSAIAEILSAIAIVATLIYLSIQTQQTNRALIGATRAAMLSSDQEFALAQANDEEFALAVVTGDFSSLSPEKLAQNQIRLVQAFRLREFAWFQYQDGLLDERTWEAFLPPLLSSLRDPGSPGYQGWQRTSPQLDAEFVREINRRVDHE